jgi:hypothetical protein
MSTKTKKSKKTWKKPKVDEWYPDWYFADEDNWSAETYPQFFPIDSFAKGSSAKKKKKKKKKPRGVGAALKGYGKVLR